MHFRVDPEALQGDSGAVRAGAQELARVDVGQELVPLEVAFPGGVTAAAIREMGARWSDRLIAARSGLSLLGVGLGLAAESYAGVEAVVQRALDAGDRRHA